MCTTPKQTFLRALFKKLDSMTTGPGSFSKHLGICAENIQDTHQIQAIDQPFF